MSHAAAIALAASPSREAYEHWLVQAAALPEEDVSPPRFDVHVAVLNVQAGMDAVLAEPDALAELPAGTTDKVVALGALASATSYAQVYLDRAVAKPSTRRAMVKEGHRLRKLLLTSADALAAAGLFDAERVAAIHAGRGPIDMAGDCVVLAQLYREAPAVWADKVPFGAHEIEETGRLGDDLLRVLRPATAPKKVTENEITAATKIRNQLWTLLTETWERDLWRVGAWVFGRSVDEKVPGLGSRTRVKKEEEETEAAAASGSGSAAS